MKSSSVICASLLFALLAGFSSCKENKSGEKAILEFWVGDVEYQISGASVTHFYSKASADSWTGWVAMPVAPSKVVVSKGAVITPPVTDARDFEAGVQYTVTAEDGSQQTYTVKAEREAYLP